MKKALLFAGLLALVVVSGFGCSGAGGDVSEGGALDKHEQMKKATEATVSQDVIDKTKN